MAILAIETSSGKASVALYSDKTLLAFVQNQRINMQAENLFPLIDQVFEQTGLDYSKINYLVTSTGPGSFTGIRIGLSAAKGIGIAAKNVQLMACSNFEVIAFRAMRQTVRVKDVVVILQCSEQTLYLHSFDSHMSPHHEARIIRVDELGQYLEQYTNLTAIAGNGIQTALTSIPRRDNLIILPRYPELDARLLVILAGYKLRFNKLISYELEPLYIKPVSAKIPS